MNLNPLISSMALLKNTLLILDLMILDFRFQPHGAVAF
jgi:hypothetical protein